MSSGMGRKKKALVVVLGDLARSPRMQYHCLSLAKNDYDVTVIANGGGPSGDKACKSLEANRNIRQLLMMNDPIDFKKQLPSILAYLIKPIWQTLLLMIQLFIAPRPHVIILQNPPSIPTLPIIYLYTRLVRSRLIIDWHNYGFSILRLNLKRDNLIVRISKFIEIHFGRLADAGFCVSEAMQRDLMETFHITYPVYVLYDKPPSQFEPLSLRKREEFFTRIQDQLPALKSWTSGGDGGVRPAIVLSSTSWTEDEDFGLLLEALKLYDKSSDLPKLICVITGKGPLKTFYQAEIDRAAFNNITMVLPWLSAEDYAKMVGSCDVGISLHSSSSGVDLPMKVVDMFGCGIPVLAYRYQAINELVLENEYGRTFKDSLDLFLQLGDLLADFNSKIIPNSTDSSSQQNSTLYLKNDTDLTPLERYRNNIIRHFLKSRWDTNWNQVARPLFDMLSKRADKRAGRNLK